MGMVAVSKIVETLGLDAASIQSYKALTEAVEQGLPVASLEHVVDALVPRNVSKTQLLNRIIPQASRHRRKERRLAPAQSERVERIARAYATALYVFDDKEEASAFMFAAHPLLEGQSPFETARSELGARRVEELLWRIYHGLAV